MRGGDTEEVATSVAALRAAGATVVDAPLLDVRDEALEITRRYWNRAQLDGRANEQLLWDWDRFQRRMLQCMAPIDALLVPATTEPAPPWRESIDTDYVWQLPWSLTGSPAVVLPVGRVAQPARRGPGRRATLERPHRPRGRAVHRDAHQRFQLMAALCPHIGA